MNGIYDTDDTFDFKKLVLISPTNVAGGNHFIKFRIQNAPLYIQPPKCKTRQGIIKSGKKMFCDLMFSNEDESFIQWMENLELHCRDIIYKNRTTWFETDIDEHDIEDTFTSPLKVFKSGKCYLLRTNVPSYLGECTLTVYNEDEQEMSIQEIEEDMDVNTILEIQGIRCSPRSFMVDIEVKQMMCIKPKNIFKKCLFKRDRERENGNLDREHERLTEKNKEREKEQEKDTKSISLDPPPPNPIDEIAKETPSDIFQPMEINLDTLDTTVADAEVMCIKNKKDIYYQMYRDAKKKAKLARDLALSSYLEAKKIKNTYMLEDLEDSDSDLDGYFDEEESNEPDADAEESI